MNRFVVMLMTLCCCIVSVQAQTARDYIRRGNRLMLDTLGGNDESEKAIVQYKKAIEMDTTMAIAHYNLGTALIRQNNAQEAMKEFQTAAKFETDKKRLSDIYHNMGVLLHVGQKYAEAVECYKESLRNDPSNHETRYNYILAKWHLKNQQGDGGENEQDQKDKEQQQDKQDEKQNQQQNQDKKQEEKNQQDQQSQQKEEQPNMSKENAERILQAAMRNEKETQEKIQRQQQDTPRRRLLKQW
ncbi:MAG: tetratricopeptide repeat protein [Bacteroidaceae bacterium]|jgi:Ca-activated chloride channel family protein|nr:tetratricopeptide repeat protein [Bacteroidaceae bacterium]